MPKVTVIVANYNYGCFLEKRIQTILNQTYQDFEVIYLDNASTDDSNEVFARFVGDKRIRAIHNQVNSGTPYTQWRQGMSEAEGDYAWITDSDDYADECLLAELVTLLDKHPTVGIAYCQSWRVDENDEIQSSMQDWTTDLDEQRWKKDFVNNGRDECSRYLIFKCTIPNPSGVLIRREVYEKVGGVDEKMRVAGDWMLWAKMLFVSDIAFIAKPLNYYRKHENSLSTSCHRYGLSLEKACQTFQYISKNLQVEQATLEEVNNKLIDWWLNSIVRHSNLELSRNKNIYRILSDIDPRINRRIINRWLLKKPVEKLGSISLGRKVSNAK